MSCPVAKRLIKTYSHAVRVLHGARAPLLAGILPSDPEFATARAAESEATSALTLARREYWRHVRLHGCAQYGQATRQQETEGRLRKEMLMARELFDGASEKHDYLVSLSVDSSGTPDGQMAYEQARRVRVRAYEVYFEALRRYADYAMFGELPEEPDAEAPEPIKPN